LTYALVEEGLRTADADVGPRDGQVTVPEWLDYATQRVPQLQQEDALRPGQNVRPAQEQAAPQQPQGKTRQQRGRQGAKRAHQFGKAAVARHSIARDKRETMKVTVKAFAFELQSCKLSGGDVACELTLTNITGVDKEFFLCQKDYRVTRRGKTRPRRPTT